MNQAELQTLLTGLIATWENEVVEFKEVGNSYSTSDIGKYFSALSNEANLRRQERAWLVFGINNKTRAVTTTDYRVEPERLQATKKQVVDGTEPSITFRNIYELPTAAGGRVILFEIPAAPRGMPIAWNGHWYARAGEALTALGPDKLDEIRQQTLATDWSAQVVPNATVDDLDLAALQKARESLLHILNKNVREKALFYYGLTYVYEGKSKESSVYFKKLVREFPGNKEGNNTFAYRFLGDVSRFNNQLEQVKQFQITKAT